MERNPEIDPEAERRQSLEHIDDIEAKARNDSMWLSFWIALLIGYLPLIRARHIAVFFGFPRVPFVIVWGVTISLLLVVLRRWLGARLFQRRWSKNLAIARAQIEKVYELRSGKPSAWSDKVKF